jgi:hypothetical protein
MSARLDAIAQRKKLLVSQLQLQRMETTLRSSELREAFRPSSLIGGAVAQPAALIALIDTVASLFGLRRFSRFARLAGVALVVARIVRNWRGRPARESPVAETPEVLP